MVESKIVVNLAPLTDDKSLFRQWGGKLCNALAHVNKGYAWAMEGMKDCLEKGGDPEEELMLGVGAEGYGVDLAQGVRP